MTKGEVPMMRIVAELMIAANAAVAEKIVGLAPGFGGCALVRRHPPPRAEGFDELAGLMKRAGVSLDASNGVALASSLASAVKAASDKGFTDDDGRYAVRRYKRSPSFDASRGGGDGRVVPRGGDPGDVRGAVLRSRGAGR